VESSDRLENILQKVSNLDRATRLYLDGVQAPWNSSYNTLNVRQDTILETCAAPAISAALSAVLNDFNLVQKIPDTRRTRERLEPILQLPHEADYERWDHEHTKRRIICAAVIKKSIQRNDRFAHLEVPACSTLQELHRFLNQNAVLDRNNSFQSPSGQRRYVHSTMKECFKLNARNRGGQPTLLWELLDRKLNHLLSFSNDSDRIEAFLLSEKRRIQLLQNEQGTPVPTSALRQRQTSSTTCLAERQHRREPRNLFAENSRDTEYPQCDTCQSRAAVCTCLVTGCPFHKNFSCSACFHSNHPLATRNHEQVSLRNNTEGKSAFREWKRNHVQAYCPEYLSGPFCILQVLFEASVQSNPELSLTEEEIKFRAQETCRSNLFDSQQARGGRSAFAGVQGLCAKELVRKELIPGRPESSARYSLLPAGETMAQLCSSFSKSVRKAIGQSQPPLKINQRIKLIADTREDGTFSARLLNKCCKEGLACEQRDLAAGDYMFVSNDDAELAFDFLMERKTWSDLADSVNGKGRRRLDCLHLNNNERGSCKNGENLCQLCRMKRSGCQRLFFFVEGARCLNRDTGAQKCSPERFCKHCREIHERHGISQHELESVIFELQIRHGCYVHFVRDYNETITSLLIIASMLQVHSSRNFNLPYDIFQYNCRQRDQIQPHVQDLGKTTVVEWADRDLTRVIHEQKCEEFFADSLDRKVVPVKVPEQIIDLSEQDDGTRSEASTEGVFGTSQESVQATGSWGRARRWKPENASGHIIAIDSDSDDDNDVRNVSQSSIEILQVVAPQANRRHSSPTRAVNDKRRNSLKLVTVSGLYEYDLEFLKDMNAFWKRIYSDAKVDARGSRDLASQLDMTVTSKIKAIQQGAQPLVMRNDILYFLLLSQIRYNALLHVVRQEGQVALLREAWEHGWNDPVAEGLDSAHQCTICHDIIPRIELQSLPCSHTFHVQCIQQWFETRTEQTCPVCKQTVDRPKDDSNYASPRSRGSHRTPRSRESTASHALGDHSTVRRSPERSALKEARLRRFASRATPTASLHETQETAIGVTNDRRHWTCEVCTLENSLTLKECAACGSAARQNLPTKWSCDRCTFLNDPACRACVQCDEKNPFHTTPDFPEDPLAIQDPVFGAAAMSGERCMAHDELPVAMARFQDATRRVARTRDNRRGQICGACKQVGHNRGTATAANCPMYNTREEVELRRKKREQAERRMEETERELAEVERMRNQQEERQRNAEQAMADLVQAHNATMQFSETERKRLRKQRERARKRARTLQG